MEEDKHPTEVTKRYFNAIAKTPANEQTDDFLELSRYLKNPPSPELKKELLRKITGNYRVEQLIATIANYSKK